MHGFRAVARVYMPWVPSLGRGDFRAATISSQRLGGAVSAEERVDLAKFRAIFQRTASRIQQQPDRVAASGPRASVRVVKDRLFEARVRDFTFQMDEPELRGGGNTAPSPMEYFVAGAAG
jgi:hypothetical protein